LISLILENKQDAAGEQRSFDSALAATLDDLELRERHLSHS